MHDMLDIDRAGKVSGSRFYYLKNAGAMLEMALTRYAMDMCLQRGFMPVLVPVLVPDIIRHEVECMQGATLLSLPMKMAGMGRAFRAFRAFRAEGLSGSTNRGLYRIHQFTKVELFALTRPTESMDISKAFIDI
ncbi:hypothetical protein BASA83_004288 [Batrachochytrium salamandrivorans]|nr:hypothetical protein BASA83_004288 [Batrachochytrium salamandrivorans]